MKQGHSCFLGSMLKNMKSREELMFISLSGDDTSPLLSENDFSTGSIQLSILKLDSTSFNVRVRSRASVHELKNAVQTEFGVSQNEEQGKIPWGIVWENFCLTYESHKLVDDSILLSSLGIKDSDQLCFVRHNSAVKEGEKLSSRKHAKLPPFRKRSSDRPKVPRGGTFAQIEVQWTQVLKTCFSYSKVWITRMKPDWKHLHLKQ